MNEGREITKFLIILKLVETSSDFNQKTAEESLAV